MALRIGDYVLGGELRNTRANGVYGWLQLGHDCGLHIELTGNLGGELQRKHIRFGSSQHRGPSSDSQSPLPEAIEKMADRQIGVIGSAVLRQVLVPTVPIEEFCRLSKAEQQRCSVEQECLYLEWFSQNGRVVAEILNPEIEYIDARHSPNADDSADGSDLIARPPAEDKTKADLVTDYLDHGDASSDIFTLGEIDSESSEGSDEDPYGLFDPDLQHQMWQSLGNSTDFADDQFISAHRDFGISSPSEKRSWDEVIPGIDPETKALYEQWDEIFDGQKDEPIACLFETPLRLPPPDQVTSEEQARDLVISILAQLALLSVAIDVCEHFTLLQTYRLLVTDILPTAKVHPNLAASSMVQHYSTSDFCAECEAEFEAEFEAFEGDEADPNQDNSND